jgi:hypothetical protein
VQQHVQAQISGGLIVELEFAKSIADGARHRTVRRHQENWHFVGGIGLGPTVRELAHERDRLRPGIALQL